MVNVLNVNFVFIIIMIANIERKRTKKGKYTEKNHRKEA